MRPEKILVSHSYMGLWVPEKVWWKLQNGQLAPKSLIFKMAENNHGACFHMWVQNSNAYNLCTVGKKKFSGLLSRELGSKNGHIFSYWQQGHILKVAGFVKNGQDMKHWDNKITEIV